MPQTGKIESNCDFSESDDLGPNISERINLSQKAKLRKINSHSKFPNIEEINRFYKDIGS